MSELSDSPPGGAPSDSIAGDLVVGRFAYDGGRRVTTYVPPDRPQAIVFAADGQIVSLWGRVLERADVPPTMVVGVHGLADENLRLHEYSPKFDPERFRAHRKFFVNEVQKWVRSRFAVSLPAYRTAVYGASAGAELALALGARHPDLFGAVLAASPGGGYRPTPELVLTSFPRTYLVAGTEEPFFLENAARWAKALREAGVDLRLSERPAGHDSMMWREEFPAMIAWAFGPRHQPRG